MGIEPRLLRFYAGALTARPLALVAEWSTDQHIVLLYTQVVGDVVLFMPIPNNLGVQKNSNRTVFSKCFTPKHFPEVYAKNTPLS